ncbi:MAG: transglycosylase SLT domain-containing protein [Rhodocyclaceae bacterium]|nr:transglycosylase SLT domain-containing protein [Rhodocyclaceae bacterium]
MKPATALFRALCAACAALLLVGCGTLFSKSKAPDDEPIGLKLPPSMAADTEPPPVDMDDPWQRLRAGFAVTDIDDPEVLVLQNNLLKHPRSTRTALKNARRYLPLVLDELERRELPTELALIPLIESHYNPTAGRGNEHVGLWQFGSGTARTFNLSLDDWVDDRMDIVASTRAAFEYLNRLHNTFGDWHLAIAAYNRGANAMMRSLPPGGLNGPAAANLGQIQLPRTTRHYLIALQAWENLLAAPEVYGLTLPSGGESSGLVSVSVPRGLDFKTAAELGGLSVDELRALNPGYRHEVIHRHDATLLVPAGTAQKLINELDGRTFPAPQLPASAQTPVVAVRKQLAARAADNVTKSGKRNAKAAKSSAKAGKKGKTSARPTRANAKASTKTSAKTKQTTAPSSKKKRHGGGR